jgi:predicted N-acetyltransferase YhbS
LEAAFNVDGVTFEPTDRCQEELPITELLRSTTPEDASECSRICFDAFKAIADRHGFSPFFVSLEYARRSISRISAHPKWFGVVAEHDGRIVGCYFMDERTTISGIGPVCVDPSQQDKGIGRRLMRHALDRVEARNAPGVRLVQETYHYRSFSLYATLGFQAREPLSVMQGPPLKRAIDGSRVRPALDADVDACRALSSSVLGFDRAGTTLTDAIDQKTAMVVDQSEGISGYATLIGSPGHAVGKTNRDLMALIAAAPEFVGVGFMVPTRNHQLLSWCLANGLRVAGQSTLMSIGLYNEPSGAYLASGGF